MRTKGSDVVWYHGTDPNTHTSYQGHYWDKSGGSEFDNLEQQFDIELAGMPHMFNCGLPALQMLLTCDTQIQAQVAEAYNDIQECEKLYDDCFFNDFKGKECEKFKNALSPGDARQICNKTIEKWQDKFDVKGECGDAVRKVIKRCFNPLKRRKLL